MKGFLISAFGNVVVDLPDHSIILVAHPFNEDFHGDVGIAAHGAEGMAEVVGANGDAAPWGQLAFRQKLLMRLGFAVPALVTAVEFGFHVGDIAFPGTIKGRKGCLTVLGLKGKAVFAGKENAQGRKKRK